MLRGVSWNLSGGTGFLRSLGGDLVAAIEHSFFKLMEDSVALNCFSVADDDESSTLVRQPSFSKMR